MTNRNLLRIALLVLLVGVLVLAGSVALAQGPAAAPAYVVEPGSAAGTGYRLAGGTWQAAGSASGPGYHLEAVGRRILQGAGCCCTYLPCISRGN